MEQKRQNRHCPYQIDAEKLEAAEMILVNMNDGERKQLADEIENTANWPALAKRVLWMEGAMSPKIRKRVTEYLAAKI